MIRVHAAVGKNTRTATVRENNILTIGRDIVA
ncbi:hypothetical protein IGI49_001874 [Enterococcus sp. AZ071]